MAVADGEQFLSGLYTSRPSAIFGIFENCAGGDHRATDRQCAVHDPLHYATMSGILQGPVAA